MTKGYDRVSGAARPVAGRGGRSTVRSVMEICNVCWDLRGRDAGDGCDCDRAAHPRRPEESEVEREAHIGPWLCHTCQLVVIPPAGRWTRLHCDTCRPHVEEINRLRGELVVPLGIHSAVNGFLLDIDPASEEDTPDDVAATFAAQLARMGERIEWMTAHRRARTARLVDELGFRLDRPVKLHKFVDKCRDRGFDEEHGLMDLLDAVDGAA